MKRLFSIAFFLLLAMAAFSQTKLTVFYKFANIVEGYDHDTKTEVFIDGESMGTSGVAAESKGGTVTVNVPMGEHNLRVVNYALYEGEWEEHTIDNEYSIDCIYETTHKFGKKPEKLYLLFDIDQGTLVSWKKPVKVKK